MDPRLDAIAGMGRLVTQHPHPSLDWDDPRLLGWSDLLATAIWPALDAATRRRHAPALEGFQVAHALNTARNVDIRAQLGNVVACLNSAGIEPVVFKGAGHLATSLWPTPGARLIADIDLLVAPEQANAAVAALEALAGTGPQAREHPELTAQKSHLPPVQDAGGPAPVEIHHRVFSRGAIRLAPADGIRARAVPLDLGGGATPAALVPSPTDRVLIAMLHGPAGSGTWAAPALHMRDLIDIAFLAERHADEIDWTWIETHLGDQGWAVVLEITNRCLDRFIGLAPPFRRPGWAARRDADRWVWQLEHPATARAGRAANLVGYGLRSLAAGGEARRWALGYMVKPATYARAFRRYVLGRDE